MQPNAPLSYFFKIHFTLFSYFHTDLSSDIFHSEFTHQNSICTSPLSYAFYMPRPPFILDFITRIIFGEEYTP